jgi:hypothetical protein
VAGEQKIRAFLFYLSLLIFFVGLPFILSFALGYKFNTKTLKFTKSGFIDLKTQPQGAIIYLDGKLLNDKTPTSINELMPGKYNLKLALEEYYPWLGEVNVEAGKVTRLDKIILFPLRPHIKQLNKEKISSFWIDKEKGTIYYIDDEHNIIYISNLEGEEFRAIGSLPETFDSIEGLKVSSDRKKLMCYNVRQIAIVYLNPEIGFSSRELPFVLNFSNRKLIDVFWHSDSYHLILVTNKNIEVLEAKENPMAVNLVNLNKRSAFSFYEQDKDILYFLDSGRAPDEGLYDNVYKLELSTRIFPFHELRKSKTNEPR